MNALVGICLLLLAPSLRVSPDGLALTHCGHRDPAFAKCMMVRSPEDAPFREDRFEWVWLRDSSGTKCATSRKPAP